MRIGIFDGAINDGTLDVVVSGARTAEAEGFDSFWVPQIFGHDALTALAIIGGAVPRIELGDRCRGRVGVRRTGRRHVDGSRGRPDPYTRSIGVVASPM